jgi:hypothetical protein
VIAGSVRYRSHQLIHRTLEAAEADFWNPNARVPICLDARAAHSYFLHIRKWTGMAVAGRTKAQMNETIPTAIDKKELPAIESEPICSMMSKLGYADDRNEHLLPHLRSFYSETDPATRGWSESAGFSLPGWERRPGAPDWVRDGCRTVAGRNGTSQRLTLAHHP